MNAYFLKLARGGLFLAFLVVTIGAWVRLTDAGLGCPDWPGCYGQFFVPDSPLERADALSGFPERPLEVGKAWREMIHRYLASGLGFLCVLLAGMAWLNRHDPKQPIRLPFCSTRGSDFSGNFGHVDSYATPKTRGCDGPFVGWVHYTGALILAWKMANI